MCRVVSFFTVFACIQIKLVSILRYLHIPPWSTFCINFSTSIHIVYTYRFILFELVIKFDCIDVRKSDREQTKCFSRRRLLEWKPTRVEDWAWIAYREAARYKKIQESREHQLKTGKSGQRSSRWRRKLNANRRRRIDRLIRMFSTRIAKYIVFSTIVVGRTISRFSGFIVKLSVVWAFGETYGFDGKTAKMSHVQSTVLKLRLRKLYAAYSSYWLETLETCSYGRIVSVPNQSSKRNAQRFAVNARLLWT